MKSMVLYWFSGTGNTWLAAQSLADALRGSGVTVTLRRMEAASKVNLPSDETLGLAFPIACFSTYPLVWRFLEALPAGQGREVVALATMGGASGGMAGPLGRFLCAKGYHPIAARMFAMPGNYANRMIPAEANAQRIARMRTHVAAFAQDLLAGKATWPHGYPLWSNTLTKLSRSPRPWRFFKNVYPLAVDADRCTRCGLCAKLCPVGCIHMEDVPVWSAACESCQRCIGYCPAHAIHVPGKPAAQYAAAPLDAMLNE